MTADKIRKAATVIVHRDGHVLLVERSKATRVFPGYHAFPGGTLDPGEDFRAGAAREVMEEVGLALDPAALVPAGRITTPAFHPSRFDTQFFMAEAPRDFVPVVQEAELAAARWWRPADAVAAFEATTHLLPPPTLAYLRLLSKAASFGEAAAFAESDSARPHHQRFHIEFHPGLYALPLKAPTLPPATTVTVYVAATASAIVVVDPGTPHQDEQLVLVDYVERLIAERRPRERLVVLTHHHGDHTASAELLKGRLGFRVLAHAETSSRVEPGLVDREIREGDAIDLAPGWRLEVLHTPGHAPGHVCLRDSRHGALLVGDMASVMTTILVDPEEGDMGAYLRSLERLVALNPPMVMPAHGPGAAGVGLLAATLKHRRDRQARIEAALAKGPRAVDDIAADAYADTPDANMMLATSQVESVLLMLEREGRARRAGAAWAPAHNG